jgi:phospholipid/cholesterol/gamma-HCH transport system substrate-binding protein
MNKSVIETLTGAFVLGVAAWFLSVFLYKNADLDINAKNYLVNAKFEQAEGISTGSSVRIGGIKIGVITGLELDPNTYYAIVQMSIREEVKIPTDSTAKIVSDGLLGSKYLSIIPGAEDEMVLPNGEIRFTQSSVNLETLIGKMMFGKEKN